MLNRKWNQWQIYLFKVKGIRHGESFEQWAIPNKQWWIDFENKWDHTNVTGFEEIELTEEQIARYEEIKDMPEDFFDMYVGYILTSNTSDDVDLPTNHPFQILRMKKKNDENTDYLVDVDFRLSMVELGI